jgi:NAD(P)-dependent dehydrogenase (short-subunit alcohol dehydrogenase family)
MEKASATADVMRKQTGNANIEPYGADLSSMSQVRSLATAVRERHPRVTVLLNNAGPVSHATSPRTARDVDST